MYNFELIKKEFVSDIASEVFLYKHKSGARLVFVKNDDENRVIMPVFKTIPEDDKGAAHIVEHCTLCGSEKYPLKDPFNVLEKGSIYTYLNAITCEDKTVYPIASTDPDELEKMARVYADALFNPLFLENEGIFQQEGVHCGENGINGVVLNEMEGAFASESKLLHHNLRKALYKECCYANYSGGVPDSIKTLTYEEFKAFYMTRYHGKNCLIYIYGAVDINLYMQLFDGYLIENSEEAFDDSIIVSNSDKAIKVKAGKKAKGICGAMFACCNAESYMECVLLSVLGDVLVSGDNAILRQSLVDSGKAVKIGGGYNAGSRATKLYVYAEGTAFYEFKETLKNTFTELAEGGIPKEKIKSSVDRLKFYIKERDFGYKPTGLFFGLELMKGLLYDDISFEPLKIEAILDKAEQADYSGLIKKYFVNKGVYGYTVNEEKDKVSFSMPINDEPLQKLRAQTDSEEMLSSIPPKSLKSVYPKPLWFDYSFENGCLFTEDKKSDIVYLDLVYPIAELNISAAALYSYGAPYMEKGFIEQTNMYFGKFMVEADSFTKNERGIPLLAVTTAFMRENIAECVGLINRFISGISFADGEKLNRLVTEQRANYQRGFSAMGNIYAVKRCLASLNYNDVLKDKAGGVGMYLWLCSPGDFSRVAQKVSDYIKNAKPIAVLRGNMSDKKYICENIELGNSLPPTVDISEKKVKAAGYIINSRVNYSALALKIPCYNGFMEVAESIIEKGYIWDKIRLEGGAYGGGCRFLRNNSMYMYSYRDPQLQKTIAAFNRVGQYLSELKLTKSEFERFAIGSAAELLKPVKNKTVNLRVLSQVLLGREYDKELENVRERLECSPDNIREIGLMLMENMDKAQSVSFGGDRIKDCFGADNCTRLV